MKIARRTLKPCHDLEQDLVRQAHHCCHMWVFVMRHSGGELLNWTLKRYVRGGEKTMTEVVEPGRRRRIR